MPLNSPIILGALLLLQEYLLDIKGNSWGKLEMSHTNTVKS